MMLNGQSFEKDNVNVIENFFLNENSKYTRLYHLQIVWLLKGIF